MDSFSDRPVSSRGIDKAGFVEGIDAESPDSDVHRELDPLSHLQYRCTCCSRVYRSESIALYVLHFLSSGSNEKIPMVDLHAPWTFRKHRSARFPARQTLLISRRCASRVRRSSIVIRARGPLNSPQLGEKWKLEGNSGASAFRASSHHLLGVRHGRLTDEIYSADCFNQESPRNVITCPSFTDSSYFVRNAKMRVIQGVIPWVKSKVIVVSKRFIQSIW